MRLVFERTFRHVWMGQSSAASGVALALAVAAIGFAALFIVAWQGMRAWQELAQARDAGVQLAERAGRIASVKQPAPRFTKEQLLELNTAVHQLNTPWSTLFAVLERRTPTTVALVSIEPDAAHQSVRVQAEARTLDELMAYVRAMHDDGAIDQVQLLDHETNEQDGSRPVRLNFELTLRPSVAVPRTSQP